MCALDTERLVNAIDELYEDVYTDICILITNLTLVFYHLWDKVSMSCLVIYILVPMNHHYPGL